MKFVLIICSVLAATSSLIAQQRVSLSRSQIKEAESRLANLGYWTGPIDGLLNPATRSALIAFQKWQGRAVTGELTLEELAAIRDGTSPQARDVGYAHVEIDLDHQVLMIVNSEGVIRVLPVSTGNNKSFIDEGQESVAYTPRGRFIVYEKEVGWQTGSLGSTYYANFISGGVAIHGSRNVPVGPASHGCIRVPMFAARAVSRLMPLGTIVLVYDKTSFVSAKEWVENPALKEAALLNIATTDDTDYPDRSKTPSKLPRKRPRTRIVRAD